MKYAESMDSTIKLVAISEKIGDGIMARVAPAIVSSKSPLYSVEDVLMLLL